jgi:hypothetical protein
MRIGVITERDLEDKKLREKTTGISASDAVRDLTSGKPYVFMVMPYKAGYLQFEKVRGVVEKAIGYECVRADKVHGASENVLTKIQFMIERAELVIADISKYKRVSPNVFYEIGWAHASGKTLLILCKEDQKIPTDLKGLEYLEYSDSAEGDELFRERLTKALCQNVGRRVALLKDMLRARKPTPCYIVANPRYPGEDTVIQGQASHSRTFGDDLGILGLSSAFGRFMPEAAEVELIPAQYCPKNLHKTPKNLYIIGSRKNNTFAGKMANRLQKNAKVRWCFAPPKGKKEEGDWQVMLYRCENGKRVPLDGTRERRGPKEGLIYTKDYGVILRAPHPDFPEHLVMIMAGAHSLGTAAACLAATRSPLINSIEKKLGSGMVGDKDRAMWVLVEGTVSERDNLLDEEGVAVLEAGFFEYKKS